MTDLFVLLLLIVCYCAFVLVKEDRACGKCNGWGQQTKRRRTSACTKCAGTGKRFYPGAPLVHRGKLLVIRYVRERLEDGR